MTHIAAAASLYRDAEGIQVEVRPDPRRAGDLGVGQGLAERFQERADELGAAIGSVAERIRTSLEERLAEQQASDWSLGEVALQFSVSLEAESGILISKVSSGATFQVSLTWSRDSDGAPGPS